MGYIFIDKEGDESLRTHMRRNMRGGTYYRHEHEKEERDYHDGYRMGYRHGWEDHDEELGREEMRYRRERDSRGRFI